ncbi:tRNA-intron lyase [Stetteria hydrogenophila]
MKARARLLGGRVVVEDLGEAERVYRLGFYGAPLGSPKASPAEARAPLTLNPFEAVYLAEKGLISVESDGGELSHRELYELLIKGRPRMERLYTVYKSLREKGLVVRPGLKFGADFAVYRYGPSIDHAPFLVNVVDPSEEVDAGEILRAARLSHSVRKTLTVAVWVGGEVNYIMFKWFKP